MEKEHVMATSRVNWQPSWWKEEKHGSAWERVKEALHRDWEQTKKDLHVGGHELNQDIRDTVKQAAGKQSIPPNEGLNPPKVIGDWDDDVEVPMGYGYSAGQEYGAAHARWDGDLEEKLKAEWERGREGARRDWDEVKQFVREGYEHAREDRARRS
jgi:hypothetical protein